MRSFIGALCAAGVTALVLVVTESSVNAWACDFLTGGGFIYVNGAKGTFGVGGGCKSTDSFGSPDRPYWGHLEYQDHGIGLNVHWMSITEYQEWDTAVIKDCCPVGRRKICGTASSNLYGDVYFAVIAGDAGEPGVHDQFDIQLVKISGGDPAHPDYTTFGWDTSGGYPHNLGGGTNGGGNIQLHNPNNSNGGTFGGTCPASPD